MKRKTFLLLFLALQFCKLYAQTSTRDSVSAFINGPLLVYLGENYNAEISLVSTRTEKPINVMVDSIPIKIENGKGVYSIRTYGLGYHKFHAKIEVRDSVTGKNKTYLAESGYYVDIPIAIISAIKMDIFYIGIENPINAYLPGSKVEDLIVTCENGELKNNNGYYSITVKSGKPDFATIKVLNKVNGGTSRTFTKDFKIRPLPPVSVSLNSKVGGFISNLELSQCNFISAGFDASFPYHAIGYFIQSYECIIQSNGELKKFSINGSQISPELKSAFENCKTGDMVVFYNISAISPSAPKMDIKSGPVFFIE